MQDLTDVMKGRTRARKKNDRGKGKWSVKVDDVAVSTFCFTRSSGPP